LISFFLFLALAESASDKLFRVGLLGQIIVGLIYGVPIANILPISWQETFLVLGYLGLIFIIFIGKLTVSNNPKKSTYKKLTFKTSTCVSNSLTVADSFTGISRRSDYQAGSVETKLRA
jgi:hypothetical protein